MNLLKYNETLQVTWQHIHYRLWYAYSQSSYLINMPLSQSFMKGAPWYNCLEYWWLIGLIYLQRRWGIFYVHFCRYNNLNYISVITPLVLIFKVTILKATHIYWISLSIQVIIYNEFSIVTIEGMEILIKEILVINISSCLRIITKTL